LRRRRASLRNQRSLSALLLLRLVVSTAAPSRLAALAGCSGRLPLDGLVCASRAAVQREGRGLRSSRSARSCVHALSSFQRTEAGGPGTDRRLPAYAATTRSVFLGNLPNLRRHTAPCQHKISSFDCGRPNRSVLLAGRRETRAEQTSERARHPMTGGTMS
jgi:hypothetical protein